MLDGSIVVGKISDNDTYTYGYDAQEGQYGDLVSKGIIDPTKVVRTALQDAASIAGLLVTTEAMVAEKPKKETPPMPGMPPGGGMDYLPVSVNHDQESVIPFMTIISEDDMASRKRKPKIGRKVAYGLSRFDRPKARTMLRAFSVPNAPATHRGVS
jgi:TCP-1/cpn60 chaperonin family